MGSFSIWHWLVVLMVVLLLFGSGKVSTLMGDFAKGIKSFKKNMADDSDESMEARAEKPRPARSRRPARQAGTTASAPTGRHDAEGLTALAGPSAGVTCCRSSRW